MPSEARLPAPPKPLPVRVATALRALVQGLQNVWSEDQTFSVWRRFSGSLDDGVPLDEESFRACARIPQRLSIRRRDPEDYFRAIFDPSSGEEPETVQAYRLLHTVMFGILTDVSLFTSGEDQVVNTRLFIVGRLQGGSVVGIQARMIET